jgi:hypothetical protein
MLPFMTNRHKVFAPLRIQYKWGKKKGTGTAAIAPAMDDTLNQS